MWTSFPLGWSAMLGTGLCNWAGRPHAREGGRGVWICGQALGQLPAGWRPWKQLQVRDRTWGSCDCWIFMSESQPVRNPNISKWMEESSVDEGLIEVSGIPARVPEMDWDPELRTIELWWYSAGHLKCLNNRQRWRNRDFKRKEGDLAPNAVTGKLLC